MGAVNFITLIASIMCPLTLSVTLDRIFLYRVVPHEFRTPPLFLLFFIFELYLQLGAMALIFGDLVILMTSVLVTSNFLRKLMYDIFK